MEISSKYSFTFYFGTTGWESKKLIVVKRVSLLERKSWSEKQFPGSHSIDETVLHRNNKFSIHKRCNFTKL